MHKPDTSALFKGSQRQMGHAGCGWRADGDGSRPRLGDRHEFVNVLGREIMLHRNHLRKDRNQGGGREGRGIVKRNIAHQRRVRKLIGRIHQKSITIARRLQQCIRGDDGVAAGAVFNDDILAKRFLHIGGERARSGIGSATGSEGHQPTYGPIGPIGLRMGKRAHPGCCQRGCQYGAAIDWFDHGIPPEIF